MTMSAGSTLAVYLIAPPPGDWTPSVGCSVTLSTVAAAIDVNVKEMSATTYGGAQLPAWAATVMITVTVVDDVEPDPELPLEE